MVKILAQFLDAIVWEAITPILMSRTEILGELHDGDS
jgi:hypothetical protein